MIAKLLEMATGKDDLERVAYKDDLDLLNARLKTRPLWIPRRPTRFLDASGFTQEQFLEMVEKDAKDSAEVQFAAWILDVDGKRRLPAFSSQKKMEVFSAKMSQRLNKVFSLECIEILLADVTRELDIDFVDLSLFSEKSWEIGVRKKS